MTSLWDAGPPAIPPPPPPPPLPQQSVPLDGTGNGSPRAVTSPLERITKAISSRTLGGEAYSIFHDKRRGIIDSTEYCYISFYEPVQPILQNGPVCGIVALAMSAARLGKPHVKTEDMFNRSRELNLSKQGELFSVEYMVELARDTLQCRADILDVRQDSGREQIVKKLLQDAVLLIPYDADKNHQPCLKKGHKAHWAVLTGFFLVLDKGMESSIDSLCTADTNLCGLYHCSNLSSLVELRQSVRHVMVYGQQGKSKYPGVWSLDDLLASNLNLTEVDPDRAAEAECYVIPTEGVLEGLCGRIAVLSNDAH